MKLLMAMISVIYKAGNGKVIQFTRCPIISYPIARLPICWIRLQFETKNL